MRNPVSYEFNPTAANALDVMSDILDDYYDNVIWDEWKKGKEAFGHHLSNDKTLETMLGFEKDNDPQYYYLSLRHFNGEITVVPSFAPLHKEVRTVASNTQRDVDDAVVPICAAG